MQNTNRTPTTQSGDLVQLVSPTNKIFIIRLTPGADLQTHRGILQHDDLIDQPWGSEVFTHLGKSYFILQPSLNDLLRDLKRNTQIMYPKDIGFVLVTMGIGPGVHVIEAGTGSGALTIALAWAVGPQGRVTSYDQRPEMQNLARKNLDRLGLLERVTLKQRDIAQGFDEENVDALFLDVPNPYDYLQQARQALKPGGFFGTILPTVNQITRLLDAFHQYNYAFVDVCEIMLRYYKTVSERFRPTDRMVAHTGYLAFARPMLASYKKSEPAVAPDAEQEGSPVEDEAESWAEYESPE